MTELGDAHFSISSTGTLAYLPTDPGGDRQALILVDRNGQSRVLTEVSGACSTPRFSPDGRRIAVSMGPRFSERSEIWVLDLETSRLDRLTFNSREARCPVWSPDGRQLAYFSVRGEGDSGLSVKPSDGSGAETQLTRRPDLDNQLPGSWTPHGNLLILEQDDSTGSDIHTLALDGANSPQPLAVTGSVDELGPRLSPDGRSVAYVSMETGRREVFVQRFPGGGGRWQVSSGGGDYPAWGPGGRELFYQDGSKLMAVSVGPPSGFVLGKPRLLFERKDIVTVSGVIGFANYDVSPDGKTFVMVRKTAPATRIHVVLNWFEELKRRVPTD
jgi:Tol biopolymer transport system component